MLLRGSDAVAKKADKTPNRRRPSPVVAESDKRRVDSCETAQARENRRPRQVATCLKRHVAEIKTYRSTDNFECAQNSRGTPGEQFSALLGRWRVGASDVASLLEATREVFRNVRWCRGPLLAVDADGRDPCITGKPMVGVTLKGALGIADTNERLNVFGCAQELLRDIVREPLPHWEDHPLRTRRDVLHLIQVAIRMLGATPVRRGGWSVSPTKEVA